MRIQFMWKCTHWQHSNIVLGFVLRYDKKRKTLAEIHSLKIEKSQTEEFGAGVEEMGEGGLKVQHQIINKFWGYNLWNDYYS